MVLPTQTTRTLGNPAIRLSIKSMQSQANRQEGSSHNPRLPRGKSPTKNDYMAPGLAQTAAPYYDAQSNLITHGGPTFVPLQVGSGPINNMSGGGPVPGLGSNNIVTGSWGHPAAQFPSHSEYVIPSVQHQPFGQASLSRNDAGASNDSAYHFSADQLPNNATNFPPSFQGTHAAQNNEGMPPLWRIFDWRVSYADQDELHLTIVLRRF